MSSALRTEIRERKRSQAKAQPLRIAVSDGKGCCALCEHTQYAHVICA